MIDTDKYEGHTPGPWKIYYDKWNKTGWWIDSIARWDAGEGDTICQLYGKGRNKDPTAKLIAAAPDLLAEVKRLREWIYHHAKNLDAGGVHTFADEAREAIGVKEGECLNG